jgi:AmmeMemoRadiSam system protein A
MSDTEDPLSREAQSELLGVARRAISEHLGRGKMPLHEPEAAELERELAVFVTLERDEKVCGCMGGPDPDGALHENTARMAVAAATADPAYSGLAISDLRYTEVELSVLSPHLPIAKEDIIVGTHGLYIAQGPKRAILLPQAADPRWSRSRLLEELLTKAGLTKRALRDPKTSLRAFTAQVFRDSDLL